MFELEPIIHKQMEILTGQDDEDQQLPFQLQMLKSFSLELLIDLLIDRLIDWLIDWLIDSIALDLVARQKSHKNIGPSLLPREEPARRLRKARLPKKLWKEDGEGDILQRFLMKSIA